MKTFFQFREDLDEAKFAGSSIKMFGQSNRNKPIKKEGSGPSMADLQKRDNIKQSDPELYSDLDRVTTPTT